MGTRLYGCTTVTDCVFVKRRKALAMHVARIEVLGISFESMTHDCCLLNSGVTDEQDNQNYEGSFCNG
jgi:hypothetical protein